MGAKSSKPSPIHVQPEATAVEVFQDASSEAPRDAAKKQKNVVAAQGGRVQAVKGIGKHDESADNHNTESRSNIASIGSLDSGDKQSDADGKAKKKRRRSKKDKGKQSSPRLVRAQTQLNELKNVKPLLQQSPQARQQYFEQIKDAYALDEEAKKAPPPTAQTRFFNLDNWRKAPQTPSGKNSIREEPTPDSPSPQRPHTAGLTARGFLSSGRSSRAITEFSDGHGEERRQNSSRVMAPDDVEPMTPEDSRTAPIRMSNAGVSNQLDHGARAMQAGQGKERQIPSLCSQRSCLSDQLRLDDVDEDLMENILSSGVDARRSPP